MSKENTEMRTIANMDPIAINSEFLTIVAVVGP